MGHYGVMDPAQGHPAQSDAAPIDVSGFQQEYLQLNRDALLWKLEGLSDYDARRPLTPAGTNLAWHTAHVRYVG